MMDYDDIELTPTVLKHWYIGDGTYNTATTHDYASISCVNEFSREKQVEEMVSQLGFDFTIHREEYDYGKVMNIQFTKDGTEKMFEYMGEPLPSFEYKWPNNYDYERRGE